MAWIEVNSATPTTSMPEISFQSSDKTLDAASNGIGRYLPGLDSSGGAAGRGGTWNDGARAGVFLLFLDLAPSYQSSSFGFRCAFQ